MTTRQFLAMASLLGGLGTVCCLQPQELSALSQELMLEEGSLVPRNPSSQELDNPIDDILEEIALLKADNKWLNEMIQRNAEKIHVNEGNIQDNAENIQDNAGNIQENADNLGIVDSNVNSNSEDIAENADIITRLHLAPIGTISAWVTKPSKETREVEMVNLPEGWVRCDGSTIPEPSVWAGQLTPNLNGEKRFLRGASDSEMLTLEEDQMQDHKHQVSDPGHSHSYIDTYHQTGVDGYMGTSVLEDTVYDRWDGPRTKTTASKHTGLTVQGVSSGRHGSETRPKNMNVIYIMRVW
jgi:hypothetical protein